MNVESLPGAEDRLRAQGHLHRSVASPTAAPRKGGRALPSSHAEIVIIGCGPAGYSAAVHAARADLRPLLITGIARDEALASGTAASDWPNEPPASPAPDLKRRLRDHAERASTRVEFDAIQWVNLARRPFHVQGDAGHYTCDALIIAVDRPTASALFQGQLEMKDGHIVTFTGLSGMATLTSLQGVFLAGDAIDPTLEPVVTSTGSGCMAVLDAKRFLGH